MISLLKDGFATRLLGPASEDSPAVQRSRTAPAAAAGFDPYIRRSSFDYVAESDLLVGDESRQAHSVRGMFALVRGVAALVCFYHETHLLAFWLKRIW
jgi:hypothetical protein